jgi:hypothetical protein
MDGDHDLGSCNADRHPYGAATAILTAINPDVYFVTKRLRRINNSIRRALQLPGWRGYGAVEWSLTP